MRKNKLIYLILISVTLILGIVLFLILSKDKSNSEFPATLDGVPISYEELETAVKNRVQFFEVNKQQADVATLRRETLDNMINDKLTEQYASGQNIVVESTEIEQLFNSRVSQFETEESLLKEVSRLYGIDKQAYLSSLRQDILREKVQLQSGKSIADVIDEQRKKSIIVVNI